MQAGNKGSVGQMRLAKQNPHEAMPKGRNDAAGSTAGLNCLRKRLDASRDSSTTNDCAVDWTQPRCHKLNQYISQISNSLVVSMLHGNKDELL
jgi:hypothetical protein